MINWKSILSSFNDKPTLLEWLKQVEKALKESVLTNVLTNTKDGKTAFTFKFEDGTEITTDYIQTQGADGVSVTSFETVTSTVVGDNTNTTVRAHYSNNTTDEFIVTAKNGSGNGDGKVYKHRLHLAGGTGEIYINIYSSLKNNYLNIDSVIAILSNEPYYHVWFNGAGGTGIGVIKSILDDNTFNLKIYNIGSGGTVSAKDTSVKITGVTDNVTEAK